jgi:hypothetical protein
MYPYELHMGLAYISSKNNTFEPYQLSDLISSVFVFYKLIYKVVIVPVFCRCEATTYTEKYLRTKR